MTVVVSIPKLENLSSCEDCSADLIESSGYQVCSRCGLVHDRIFTQPKLKVGINHQIRSIIYYSRTDDSELPRRLKRLNHSAQKFSTFLVNNQVVQKICDDIYLPENTKLRVITLFKQFSSEEKKYRELMNCHHVSNLLAFLSISQATKEHKIILPFSTIYNTFIENGRKIAKEKINRALLILNVSQQHSVEDYISKFEPELIKTFPTIEPKTKQILELAKLKRHFQGNDPRVFALACLYIVYYRCSKIKYYGIVKKITELNGTKADTCIRQTATKILAYLDWEVSS